MPRGLGGSVHPGKCPLSGTRGLDGGVYPRKSPFRKISHERFKTMMRMKNDEPLAFTAEDLETLTEAKELLSRL